MSLEDDTTMPQAYKKEIQRMIDDAEARIFARLAYELRSHEIRCHESRKCGGDWTSEFLPLETD